jgi:hypothetical protein
MPYHRQVASVKDCRQQVRKDFGLQAQEIVQHVVFPGVGKVDQTDQTGFRLDQNVFEIEIAVDGGNMHGPCLVEQGGENDKRVGQGNLALDQNAGRSRVNLPAKGAPHLSLQTAGPCFQNFTYQLSNDLIGRQGGYGRRHKCLAAYKSGRRIE